MNNGNWIAPHLPAYILCNPPQKNSTIRGLLWGEGDADLAQLQSYDYWAVVQARAYREIEENGRRCVEIKEHDMVFEGARAEAVRTLIALGADPARISVEVQVRAAAEKFSYDGAYLRTGDGGTSILTDYGIARAGRRGHASAKCDGIDLIDMLDGIAWAGSRGYAEAGDGGLAIIDAMGEGLAIAGIGGIAVARGAFHKLFVGRGGKAVAEIGGKIWVGDHGVGICQVSGTAYGGDESIVIGEIVSGGMGSLLVARKRAFEPDAWEVAYGIVGKDGIKAGAKYTVENNRLVEKTNEQLEAESIERNRKWLAAVAAAKLAMEGRDSQPE